MNVIGLVLVIILTGFPAIIFDKHAAKGKSRFSKAYLVFLCLLMYFIISCRDFSVGTDTYGYVLSFEAINTSYGFVFESRDYGFSILNYLLRLFINNGRLYLFFVSWPLPLSFYLLLKDEDFSFISIFLAFLILLDIEIFAFAMAGIRQTFAIFFTVLAYKQLLKEHKFLFFLFVALACSFHFSSIVFLAIFPLRNRRIGFKDFLILGIIILLVLFKPSLVLNIITDNPVSKVYGQYGVTYLTTGSFSMLAIQCFLLLPVLLLSPISIKQNPNNLITINMIWLGMIFQSCTPIIAEMFRMAFYYSIYLCIFIPKAVNSWSVKSNTRIVSILLFAFSMIYMIVFNNPLKDYIFGL